MEAPPENPIEAVNVQLPVTTSFWEREAGPPMPQSNLTYDWEEVLVVVK